MQQKSIPAQPFILVDGSSYLYRAFHALPPLTNSQGQPTGAVYGVINMLRRLLQDYQPKHVAVVFDAKGKTFRDELYAQYKATRPVMPDDLVCQIEPLHAAIRALGLPLLIIEGVEADDVIGTLATQAAAAGMFTLISSGDKDMAQLVNDHIAIINTMSNTIYNHEAVLAKFGIPPNLIVDYLSLVGDSVDNIPGIPNVGPKTAAKWLQQYGSLDGVIANAAAITGKVGENLRQNLELLPLFRQLATIRCDVALPIKPSELMQNPADKDALIALFKRLEFRTWLSELLADTVALKPAFDHSHYHTILDEQTLNQWLQKLEQADLIAVDTETTSLNYMQAEIVGLSFAIKSGEAIYIPLAHDYPGAPTQLNRDKTLALLKPLLENPNKLKVGQNLKYDSSVLANHGIQLQGIAYDTLLESYLINSSLGRHDMDSLALKYLGYSTISFEDIAGKGSKQLCFNQISLEQAAPYAAEDADITLQLHEKLWPMLQQHVGLTKVFTDIEIPLIPVLSQIERTGVLINVDLLKQQSVEMSQRIAILEHQVHELAGESFNLGSPKQLQAILFDKLKLPILERTPTGQPSTAESVLQELAHDFALPKQVLEYRSLTKLKSTYVDALPNQVNATTGRVHTCYNQAVTSTGRLSSTDPNLQNIPIRTEEGRRIRQAFIAPLGYRIIAADYSQIELRLMAHLSQDAGLLRAFEQGLDIHRATAAEVFAVALEDVTSEQRRNAKAINFGLMYGMSAFGLSRQLDIDPTTANVFIDLYFHRYPEVKKYMDRVRQLAHEQGFVETLYGRRVNLAEINSRNAMLRRGAERAAINAPLQGTAADIIKLAMINLHAWLQRQEVDARMIMQVHDELVFEVAEKDVAIVVPYIRNAMNQALALSVPLEVEIGVGSNWDEAH